MQEVPAEFDVRTAVKKRYRYLIWAAKDRPEASVARGCHGKSEDRGEKNPGKL